MAAAPRSSLIGLDGFEESNAAPAASEKFSIKNKGMFSTINR